MKELYAKIAKVMADVSYLQKDDSVQAGGSSYRAITEEKVTTAVGTAMRKHGLVIYPIGMQEHREDMEVTRSNGKPGLDRLATVTVQYRIADIDSGESDIIASAGTGVDTQDKAIGKAMTYAYKYMMLRTFAIPTGDDPDKVASDDVQPRRDPPEPRDLGWTEEQVKTYVFAYHGKETDYAKILEAGPDKGGRWLRAVKFDASATEEQRYVAGRMLKLIAS